MAKQFNNRGNHFFIEVIPNIDEKENGKDNIN